MMTFNHSENIEDIPDEKYVKYQENYFPGTIISVKLSLDYENTIEFMDLTIDLNDYKVKGSKVFTGRDRGIEIREKTKIDSLFTNGSDSDNLTIIIPPEIMSINPSFLEEFLFNIVNKLGKEKFYQKVKFSNNSERYDINEDLEEAVDRILRANNALTK